ncbi:MAG: hypothetical protein O7I93_09805 [Gemmatimonadetes bacterium]|nr:hypothetical protein [Gemmatimonadota bacterium]
MTLLVHLTLVSSAWTQETTRQDGPIIDTVIVVTQNVFGEAEAGSNAFFRIANAVRVKTNARVVRRELLFRAGEPYDSAKVAESARNLRALGVFRDVAIDSVRVDGRLAVLVQTADGWSTQLNLTGRFTEGTFTWGAGISERNFLGTATLVGASYRKGVDRNAVTLQSRINRLFGSRITASGFFENLSDGSRGGWSVGNPFRAFGDRRSLEIVGERADQRLLRFVSRSTTDQDTVRFQRRAFINRVEAAVAPVASTRRYIRMGLSVQVRREEILLQADTGLAIPDTVTAAVGVFVQYRRANFKVVTHYNGFAQSEDLDLSTTIRVAAWVAPSAFGYERTGIGPRVTAATGASLPFGFIRASALAGGLFTSAGLDSGRVAVQVTVGSQFIRRQATFLHFRGGMIEGVVPGREFDLGHGVGPRSFGPHAFTGDRNVWGTFEHRVFLIDDFLNLFGIGFAGFLDYGGAWFDGQEPRFGGNVGLGLRTGATRATGINVGRFDVGYRFGEGWTGRRWALSIGQGFTF